MSQVLEHLRKRTMKQKSSDDGCRALHASYLRKVSVVFFVIGVVILVSIS